MRAGEGHVIARRKFPLLGELFADQQRLDAVSVGRKIEASSDDALQRLIGLALALRVNAFCYHAASLPRERKQHRLVDGWCGGTHAGRSREFRGHFLIVPNSAGTRPGERNMCRHSEQPVLKRFAEPRVHGQSDHQGRDAGRYANDGKQRDQAEYCRAVRRPQVPPRHKPFESHRGWKNTLRAVRFGSGR